MAWSGWPAASRAARIAATIPSIIPLGATMSAPARAWVTATRPRISRVASLSTAPSRMTPQWPWLVYSQQHTSVSSRRSGCRARSRRSARWTMPSSAKFSVPISSFAAGGPNSSTAGMPRARTRSTSRSSDSSTERWQTPGIEGISRSTLEPWTTKSGWMKSAASRWCSRTRRRRAAVRRRRRGRWMWEEVTEVRLGSERHRRNRPEPSLGGTGTAFAAFATGGRGHDERQLRITAPTSRPFASWTSVGQFAAPQVGRRMLEARWSRLPMRTLALPASALLIGFAAASCGAPRPRLVPPPPISPSIAIVGATLWDGTGRAPVTNAVTVVRGERILCAGAAGECAIPQGARVIDGHGRYLIPGLIDSHVHLLFLQNGSAGEELGLDLRNLLAQGVTTVRDMGNSPVALL